MRSETGIWLAAGWRRGTVAIAVVGLACSDPVASEPRMVDVRPNALYETGCDPFNPAHNCILRDLTSGQEFGVFLEGGRLTSLWPPGSECYEIGMLMQANTGIIRWTDYSWGGIHGDYHTVEPRPGDGRLHVAYGHDPMNPDKGDDARYETIVHEFAHMNGAPQTGPFGDPAAGIARRCRGG